MTLLFTDPLFEAHETGQHPEQPARLRSILDRLSVSGLLNKVQKGAYSPYPIERLGRVHDPEVHAHIEMATRMGGGMLDADTVVSPASGLVALAAVGACVAAVDAVVNGATTNALALVRPPGHHATQERSMGFCLYNNIALAARHAQDHFGLARILIVDWDVHHGNGTQDIFYDDRDVFFLSLHRYGHGFYPGTGAADETGTGRGLGATLNVPMPYRTTRPEYLAGFRSVVEKVADQHRPELILISAGFDAHRLDPVGSLCLESEDYAELTRVVLDVARTHCKGRVVSCLEGGYSLNALAESVQAHLATLIDG